MQVTSEQSICFILQFDGEEVLARHHANVWEAVAKELQTATELHPEWPTDDIHQAAIVAEEAGELVRAALQLTYEKGHWHQVKKEAIQTAAMAIRLLINLPVEKP